MPFKGRLRDATAGLGRQMRIFSRTECDHGPDVVVEPRAEACEDCGATYNLRLCTECGYVGCCESQHGHDRSHAQQMGHPVIKSLPLSDRSFTWCYSCGRYV